MVRTLGIVQLKFYPKKKKNCASLLLAILITSYKTKYCEILKYSQVYEPYQSIVWQERGQTHRDLNGFRKIN